MVAAIAVLLITGAVAIVLVAQSGGDDHPSAARTTGGAAPAPTMPMTPPPSARPTETPTPDNTFKPTVAGWQVVVAGKKNGLSYDVPPDWKKNDEDTSIGLDDGSGFSETTVSFSAESRKGDCRLGGAGFHSSDVDDLRSSAQQAAQKWAKAAAYKAGSPHKSIGSPQNIELQGLNQAVQITARVGRAPDSDNCGSTGTAIRIVVLPVRGGGSLLFVLYVHSGQPGALADGDMDKVARSVRLAK